MWTEEMLNKSLTDPSLKLVEDMKHIEGDILILGAGGKMGPSLCILTKNSIKAAGGKQKVIAVSRFTDPIATKLLKDNNVETIGIDLLERGAFSKLPDVKNIIYMAGRKFGTDGQEPLTWAMNTQLPSLVAEKYTNSNIVVFSSGNVYPIVPAYSGGATEDVPQAPIGEYGMSCLGRERMFEYGSNKYGTPVFIYRLNYAVDLRYGVLYDIASHIMADEPISVSTPSFNCIWQRDANEIAIRALLHTCSPAIKMNITGPETVSVRYVADELGRLLGKKPVFKGEESGEGYLSNAARAIKIFGYPSTSLDTMIQWQAEWIMSSGRSLCKPTHFEESKGKY